jgi:hypothetical protein
MIDFTCIFEVWAKDKVQYVELEMGGSVTPKQHSMEDRIGIVDMMNENIDELTIRDDDGAIIEDIQVLDLIGVYQNGVRIWHEGAKS